MILVTGACGYIGSQICFMLNDLGLPYIAIDKESPSFSRPKDEDFIKIDLKSFNQISSSLKKYNIDCIIHLAAKSIVSESFIDPLEYFESNIQTTDNLLRFCKENSISKFIFSSTAAVYGSPSKEIIEENTPLDPINPYGNSKLICEESIKYAVKYYDLNAVIFRYFNAAGADPQTRTGESHDPETHLIPNLLKAAITNNTFNVFGNDYQTNDGTCVRDFVHVYDIALAHLESIKFLDNHRGLYILNLGSQTGHSVKEIITMAEELLDKKLKINYLPRRVGDPDRLIACSNEALDILNWKPTKSIFDILKDALKWENLK